MTEETPQEQFDPDKWHNKKITWNEKLFAKAQAFSFFHTETRYTKTLQNLIQHLKTKEAYEENAVILIEDVSHFRTNIYISTSKPIGKKYDTTISAVLISKVFTGDKLDKYKERLEQLAQSKNKEVKRFYIYHPQQEDSTHYTVILAEV
jgi:hypothetical protein